MSGSCEFGPRAIRAELQPCFLWAGSGPRKISGDRPPVAHRAPFRPPRPLRTSTAPARFGRVWASRSGGQNRSQGPSDRVGIEHMHQPLLHRVRSDACGSARTEQALARCVPNQAARPQRPSTRRRRSTFSPVTAYPPAPTQSPALCQLLETFLKPCPGCRRAGTGASRPAAGPLGLEIPSPVDISAHAGP